MLASLPRRARRGPQQHEDPPGAPRTRSLPVRRTQLVRAAVWVAVAAGPLALVASCARPDTVVRTRPAPLTETDTAEQPVDPGGYAVLFLDVWLRAGSGEEGAATEQLRALAPSVQPPSWAGKDPVAERLTVVRSVHQAGAAWSVTIAASLKTPTRRSDKGPADGAGGLRYFAVPLVVKDTGTGPGTARGVVVPTAPMEVSAPRTADAPNSAYSSEVPAESALAETAGEFLTAYLGAAKGADRYLAPGVSLPALGSAPFERVRVEEVQASQQTDGKATGGTTARLLVQVTASDQSGGQWPLAYALKLGARDGRWEVLALQSGLEDAAEQSKQHAQRSASTTAVRAITVSTATQEVKG